MNYNARKPFGQLYQETIDRENIIRKLGYKLVVIWESEWKYKRDKKLPL